jgi:hypothetical protein
MASTPASLPHAGSFDAPGWLAAWTENGGIYFLAGDMLHLRRHRPIDRRATMTLDRLRDHMLRSGGGPAIAELLLRQREGDVP